MGSRATMDGVGKRKVQGWLVHKDSSLIRTINPYPANVENRVNS